eukprot:361895-Chlamydomonas_euryale.AAC.4
MPTSTTTNLGPPYAARHSGHVRCDQGRVAATTTAWDHFTGDHEGTLPLVQTRDVGQRGREESPVTV